MLVLYINNRQSKYLQSALGAYVPQTLLNHTPIIITEEQDFIDYGFLGNGSATNPYIIENLNISTSEETAIAIYNVSVFYVIRNCFVKADRYGIYIENTSCYVENSDSYLPIP